LVLLDFGTENPFGGPYQFVIGFDSAATSYDAAGVENAWAWGDGTDVGIWVPDTADFSSATFIVDNWTFTETRSISSVVTGVAYQCPNTAVPTASNCASVSGQVGVVLKFDNGGSNDLDAMNQSRWRGGFVGISGLQALMPTAIAPLVEAPPRAVVES
jgi:hypothetical protein